MNERLHDGGVVHVCPDEDRAGVPAGDSVRPIDRICIDDGADREALRLDQVANGLPEPGRRLAGQDHRQRRLRKFRPRGLMDREHILDPKPSQDSAGLDSLTFNDGVTASNGSRLAVAVDGHLPFVPARSRTMYPC